jgi:hypothetical protein
MQRRLRPLPFALSAGIVAVIATAAPMFASDAPATQIKYTKTTSVELPKVIQMFMHHAGSSSTTYTLANGNGRVDEGDTTTITQCDLKRIIHLDNKARTYYVATFDEMMNQQAAEARAAMAGGNAAHHPTPNPKATATPQTKGSGSMNISVSEVPDDQTQTLFGMVAHHLVSTVTMTFTGTGDCKNGSIQMVSDQWWVPNELPAACPLPVRPMMPPQGGAPPGSPQGGGSPCISNVSAMATIKAHPQNRFILKETTSVSFGSPSQPSPPPNSKGMGTTHEDVTSYQKMPYDASVFEVPTGYTQVPPPTPPPMPGSQ